MNNTNKNEAVPQELRAIFHNFVRNSISFEKIWDIFGDLKRAFTTSKNIQDLILAESLSHSQCFFHIPMQVLNIVSEITFSAA